MDFSESIFIPLIVISTKYIHKEDVKGIVGKVKKRKAKDCHEWKNELVTQGGGEMIRSLLKVFNIVNETQEPPTEWNQMRIKTIHKKGAKSKMKNKRAVYKKHRQQDI